MNGKNICKFVTEEQSETIRIHNFVLELNTEIMKTKYSLNTHRIILLKEGKSVFKIDDNEYFVSSGSVIFAFSGEKISMISNEKCEFMYISFSGNRASSLFIRFGINKKDRVFAGFDGIIPLWLEALSHATDNSIDMCAESILLYTLSRFSKESSDKNNLINQIVQITENEFTDTNLSISNISERFSYNSKYLSHLFKKSIGITYSEYLRNVRIKYAVSLLEHGIDSIKNVAYLSGFSDPLYFSTVFKKVIGVSPKDYK